MPIRMQHAEHGFTNAYHEQEARELEKQGWKRETDPPPERKKPGRKPKAEQ